jgi:hypothetical protein
VRTGRPFATKRRCLTCRRHTGERPWRLDSKPTAPPSRRRSSHASAWPWTCPGPGPGPEPGPRLRSCRRQRAIPKGTSVMLLGRMRRADVSVQDHVQVQVGIAATWPCRCLRAFLHTRSGPGPGRDAVGAKRPRADQLIPHSRFPGFEHARNRHDPAAQQNSGEKCGLS